MIYRHSSAIICCLFVASCHATIGYAELTPSVEWPAPTQSAKPWTRWWWHGSAVDGDNLTRLLEEYHRVGIGGVEITCIYGVQGNEANNRTYRSAEWLEAVKHSISEAKRLGMGVDMPAGSGWRMGGPRLPREFANARLALQSKRVQGPVTCEMDFGGTPQAACARSEDGRVLDLSEFVNGDKLAWDAPAGEWIVSTAASKWSGDRVKRPGPGGAGYSINPFWRRSVNAFLDDFSSSLVELPGLRAQFHDSFEYEGDWQPAFFDAFRKRRGYRLESRLAELSGEGDRELIARVKADYRETLSDLVHDDFIKPWVDWSHRHGMQARNQAHGSPANWLDLYAACDIPETESFGRLNGGDANPLVLKFASSAANVVGRRLTSCETATWLDEHFHVTLADLKQLIARQFLSGVNHVFYHGAAYSPDDAEWPGWLFYASTQLNPQNPIWRDLPTLNAYVTRCQSLLQESQPDNDVLLYWPLHDYWHDDKGLRKDVRVHNSRDWFKGQPIGDAATLMQRHGYTFDYVSDRLLTGCEAGPGGTIRTPGGVYSAVVMPKARHMPLATLEKLAELAQAGCRVLFWDGLPETPPGLSGWPLQPNGEQHRARFRATKERLNKSALIDDSLLALLRQAEVRQEPWVQQSGLAFLRKRSEHGTLYFLHNTAGKPVDAWLPIAAHGAEGVLLDPASGRIGRAAEREANGDRASARIQLKGGESVFFLASRTPVVTEDWEYLDPAGEPTTLTGEWTVEFISGGPNLPLTFSVSDGPVPWTENADPAAQAFAGTARYTCRFDAPGDAPRWELSLGELHDSVSLRLNKQEAVTLVGPCFSTCVGPLKATGNELSIDVTGVAANRIRDLDRRGVKWRLFEDINLVTIDYKQFDASKWPIRPLGLRGPVTLTPLKGPQ